MGSVWRRTAVRDRGHYSLFRRLLASAEFQALSEVLETQRDGSSEEGAGKACV
jgi:hypothetical protein